MPSKGHDWLRIFVLKTNRTWLMRQCNRIPYSAAVRLFVGAFRRSPQIASIYLSHGLAGNEWIPGLSDIDLTVILENGLSCDEEYAFLEKFWSTYDRLKRYFPMLGEVVILVENEFALWQTYSSTTEHGRKWVLLHGRETAKPVHVEAAVWRKRALNAALWMFLESLPPYLSRRDGYLRRQDVARRERKILRYLEPQGPIEPVRDPTEAVARILRALETAAIAVSGVASPVPAGNDDGVRSVISTKAGRLLLPYSLFSYMIRHYKPYSYASSIPGISPPERSEFAAFTLDRIAYLLTMTRGKELFSMREPLSMPVLESAVTDGLAVHLLQRDGWVGTDLRAVDATCRSKFAESYRELDSVRRYLAAGNGGEARRAWFRLFRPIASGILDLAAPIRDNLNPK